MEWFLDIYRIDKETAENDIYKAAHSYVKTIMDVKVDRELHKAIEKANIACEEFEKTDSNNYYFWLIRGTFMNQKFVEDQIKLAVERNS